MPIKTTLAPGLLERVYLGRNLDERSLPLGT